MLSNIGIPGLILIVLFALIVFGPKKLPEMGKSIGRSLREFKSATKGITEDDDESAATVNKATHTTATSPLVDEKKTTSETVADKV